VGSGNLKGGPQATTVLNDDGFDDHGVFGRLAQVVPAYRYRFDYKGQSVVISGDTAKSVNWIANARGADLLIHEALGK